mgnify:CR=1 FL=1
MPEKGTRFMATRTQFRKIGSASQAPGSVGSAGAASRMSTRLTTYKTAKTRPLIATTGGADEAFKVIALMQATIVNVAA